MTTHHHIKYDEKEDTEILYKALESNPPDEKLLIEIFGRRPNYHIQVIREEYKKNYDKDLLKEVQTKLTFNFMHMIVKLVQSRSETRIEEIHKAMEGSLAKKERILVDAMTIGNKGINGLNEIFQKKYNITLVEWAKARAKGDFKKVLVKAFEGKRSEGIQEELIDQDVEKLYKAGEGRLGTDETTYREIMTQRSHEHLAKVSQKYQKKYKNTLEHAIISETSGWFQRSLLACVQLPQTYWAKRMHKAIRMLSKDDDSLLIRCFTECNKPLLQLVQEEYKRIYRLSLQDDIKGDTSGNYRELLFALLDLHQNEGNHYN